MTSLAVISDERDAYAWVHEARAKKAGSNVTLSYAEPILMIHASGVKMYDEKGREWLDCVNNVAHVGHGAPSVVEAQCRQLQLINTNARYLSTAYSEYSTRLLDTLPSCLERCIFCNSGSEANDLALQIARAARPKAQHIAVMEGAYHGHVSSMMECSPYKFWGPNGGGRSDHVHVLPVPDSYRNRNLDGGAAARFAIARATAAGARIGAFFCESALSCAGQVMLPDGFLAAVYEQMRSHGVVCIADEVQTGFGRFGSHFWGFEKQGVVPDIVVMGKAMGNGYPMAGVAVRQDLAAAFARGPNYFNTFGGSNAACASGLAVLRTIEEKKLQENATRVGRCIAAGLERLQDAFPDVIGDVRGEGLFIGAEIVCNKDSKAPSPGKAAWIKEDMKRQQILMSVDGIYENVIKIKPPLVFSIDDANLMLKCLRKSLELLESQADAVADLQRAKLESILPGQQLARKYLDCPSPEP